MAFKLSKTIYYSFQFLSERKMLQAALDLYKENVTGKITLKLYKGNVMAEGCQSKQSLYTTKFVTFKDNKDTYDQKDATSFMKLNFSPLHILAAHLPEFK